MSYKIISHAFSGSHEIMVYADIPIALQTARPKYYLEQHGVDIGGLQLGYFEKPVDFNKLKDYLLEAGVSAGWTIYYVEDDPSAAFFFPKSLKRLIPGTQVIHFESPQDFFAHLNKNKITDKAFILTDFNMPGMSGGQMAKMIRGGLITREFLAKYE
jgi:hypothetical protein